MTIIRQLSQPSLRTGSRGHQPPRLKLIRGGDRTHCELELASIAEEMQSPLPVVAVPPLFRRLQTLVDSYWLDPAANAQATELLERLRHRDLRFDDAAGRLIGRLRSVG